MIHESGKNRYDNITQRVLLIERVMFDHQISNANHATPEGFLVWRVKAQKTQLGRRPTKWFVWRVDGLMALEPMIKELKRIS